MKTFRDLQVWQKSHSVTLTVHSHTNGFPREEMYGLTSQMRRCAASIAANIAEGCGKRANGEFRRHLNLSTGSARELEYHALLAGDLNFLPEVEYKRLHANIAEIKRMLAALVRKVEQEDSQAEC